MQLLGLIPCRCQIPFHDIFGSVISSLSALVSQVHMSEDVRECALMFGATLRVGSVPVCADPLESLIVWIDSSN
jgi:hypothetical protein